MTAGWEHFAEWKRVSREEEPPRVSLETMLRGVCEPARLLDLVENFTPFQETSEGLIKLIGKNHQVLGVNNALEAAADTRGRQGRLGVFWHTQGSGKSVSIDKATAVRMHDKVGACWKRRIEELRAERSALPGDDCETIAEIDDRIAWREETDMAVVVSSSQNEIAEMKAKGLDFRRHRRRMVEEDLETKFTDADDPFRLVFVCAMWMTGFDVPSCSTLYLDKPMRNHTLMQTIARANRVYPERRRA